MWGMQLQAALEAFQVQLAADGRSEHTRLQYRRHVTGLITWLERTGHPTETLAITPTTVAGFFASDAARMSARGGAKKATSANAQRTSLRCFFRWVHESALAPTNAARLLKRARCAPPPPKALHADEVGRLRKALADAAGREAERDRMLIEFLLGTGVRLGSAIALDVEDLDYEHGEISVRRAKNDYPVSVVMSKAVAKALRRFVGKRDSGPLFLAHGRRISVRHAQRRISKWLCAAQIAGRSGHSFRHTFACDVYAKTGDLQLTQQALTHRAIASTVIYAKLDRARLRAAIGA